MNACTQTHTELSNIIDDHRGSHGCRPQAAVINQMLTSIKYHWEHMRKQKNVYTSVGFIFVIYIHALLTGWLASSILGSRPDVVSVIWRWIKDDATSSRNKCVRLISCQHVFPQRPTCSPSLARRRVHRIFWTKNLVCAPDARAVFDSLCSSAWKVSNN